MFHLTPQERLTVLFLAAVFLVGLICQAVEKSQLQLFNSLQRIESGIFYPPVNINKASRRDLENIPFLGKSMAERIVRLRTERGNFNTIEEIKLISGMTDKRYKKILPFLKI